MLKNLTYHDKESWLETIWDALHEYRDQCAPSEINGVGFPQNDEVWDDICTAMAWIAESVGVEADVDP